MNIYMRLYRIYKNIKNTIFPLVWQEIKDEEREAYNDGKREEYYVLIKSTPVLGLSYIIEENTDGTYTLIKIYNDTPLDVTSGYSSVAKAKEAAKNDFSS